MIFFEMVINIFISKLCMFIVAQYLTITCLYEYLKIKKAI